MSYSDYTDKKPYNSPGISGWMRSTPRFPKTTSQSKRQSLYAKICLICASSLFISPPTTRLTSLPSLNTTKVGIAFTLSSRATPCSLSTSTWRKRTFSYFSLSLPTTGATALQGPHQVAKKSTTTGPEETRALKMTWLLGRD